MASDGAFADGLAMDEDITNGTDAADAVAESGGSKLYLEIMGSDMAPFTGMA